MSSRLSRKIRFTKHAREKFALLERYGFPLAEAAVKGTILNPSRVERRRGQVLATRPLDEEYAIRVVYRFINDNILVVTFYPVKRKRFNV
jgi:hypothetical protein